MLEKLRQLASVQGYVHLMYNLLEMLGKVTEFMLRLGSAACGNSQRLVIPVRTLNPLMRMRVYRYKWTSWDLSSTGRTPLLNSARHPSPWSPF